MRLRFIALAVGAVMAAASVVIVALQFDAVADLLSERAALTQSYDEGPEGRFGGQEKAMRLIADAQCVVEYHSCTPEDLRQQLLLGQPGFNTIPVPPLHDSTLAATYDNAPRHSVVVCTPHDRL